LHSVLRQSSSLIDCLRAHPTDKLALFIRREATNQVLFFPTRLVVLLGVLTLNTWGAVPFIDILSPPSGIQGSTQPLSLTISGANFMSGAVVDFNGVTLTPDSVTANLLHATVPASSLAKAGTANVTVVNPASPASRGISNVAFLPITTGTVSVAYVTTPPFGSSGLAAMAIVTADFNGDGKLDLAVAGTNLGSALARVLLGDGAGNFVQSAVINFGPGTPESSLAVGDFNGDGNPDLTIATVSAGVSVAIGDGAGNFSTPLILLGHKKSW
jgi:hypothetical protein